ncbi:restriction endonuclease subunit S [Vreelandella sp. 21]|uniref:restriction endonuclease subunit S n=1 Tax=Vreelandella sp. 21 TaxID=3402864 RepID=UPI003D9A81B9
MCSKPGSMGWVETNLGSIIELNYGKSLPAKTRDGGEFPVYGSNGVVGSHSEALVTEPGIIVGRKGSYGEVQFSDKPFYPIDTTYFVNQLYEQPVRYWFYQLAFLPLNQLNRSTAIPGLNRDDAYAQEIALPPLAEQKVIADKLDTLLAQVENTKARLERIPQILKRFRQTVLAAAVSGQLTEEWRKQHGVEHGSWGVQAALDLCKKIQSGSTPKNNPFDQNGTIPFLKVYNIVNQEIDFEYRPQFITEEVHNTKLKRSIGYPGDVLMNIVGPPLGKVAILPDSYTEWNLNQAITLFRPDPKELLPNFLYYVLCEGSMVRDVTHDLKGIVGQVNISLTQCREAKIPRPSLPEQTEIVRRVEQLFAYADRIEQQVNQALVRVKNLTQSILAKAFRGELTEQWRKDNPELISGENSAEALLERIKAERAAKAPAKRTRKKATA